MNRQTADVSDKSPDQRFRESSIIQIKDVLNNVISERILDQVERVEDDFSHQLQSLRWRCVIDRSLEDATSVSVGCDFNEVGCDGIVDELVIFGYELVQAFLDNLICQATIYLTNEETPTWLPLRSLMRATTFMERA